MPIAKVVYHAREGTPHPGSRHAVKQLQIKNAIYGGWHRGTSAALLLKKKKKKKNAIYGIHDMDMRK